MGKFMADNIQGIGQRTEINTVSVSIDHLTAVTTPVGVIVFLFEMDGGDNGCSSIVITVAAECLVIVVVDFFGVVVGCLDNIVIRVLCICDEQGTRQSILIVCGVGLPLHSASGLGESVKNRASMGIDKITAWTGLINNLYFNIPGKINTIVRVAINA